MRRSPLLPLLIAEAALCLVFQGLRLSSADAFTAAAAFPLETIGAGLRALSLSGPLGNILAWALYIGLCLVPLLLYVVRRHAGKADKADLLLPLLSAALFPALYGMINPGRIRPELPEGEKLLLGGVFWSVLCAWLVLRFLRRYDAAAPERLHKGLRLVLYGVTALLVYAIFGEEVRRFLEAVRSLRQSNTGAAASELRLTYVFLGLRLLLDALPWALDILLTLRGLRLLEALGEDRYAAGTAAEAEALAALCRRCLSIMLLAQTAFNLAQLLLARTLLTTDIRVSLPLFSLAFALVVLLASGLIRENRALKRDNDLFI